jgi:hypothetical protein
MKGLGLRHSEGLIEGDEEASSNGERQSQKLVPSLAMGMQPRIERKGKCHVCDDECSGNELCFRD